MGLKERIEPFVKMQDWKGLTKMLDSLSNMELRRTERVMREEVLPELDNDLFWATLLHIIIYKRPAYLSCVRAVTHLVIDETLNYKVGSVRELYHFLKENNRASILKVCDMLFPKMRTEEQIDQLWAAFHVEDERTKVAIMLKASSHLSYFMVFKSLKMADDKRLTQECCTTLAKRGNDMAFNAACIIAAYFGLTNLPMRFSLKIEPFELNHLDRNFETFSRMLDGKRPHIMR